MTQNIPTRECSGTINATNLVSGVRIPRIAPRSRSWSQFDWSGPLGQVDQQLHALASGCHLLPYLWRHHNQMAPPTTFLPTSRPSIVPGPVPLVERDNTVIDVTIKWSFREKTSLGRWQQNDQREQRWPEPESVGSVEPIECERNFLVSK